MKSKIRAFLAVLSASILLTACCAPKVVGGAHSENNTAISTSQSKERDSIYVERWNTIYTAGDTVYIEKKSIEYKYRTKTDTIIRDVEVVVHDSIPYPVEVPVEVEVVKKVTPNWCVWLVTINVILVLVGIYKIRKKIKNKII